MLSQLSFGAPASGSDTVQGIYRPIGDVLDALEDWSR
jgi:hypothetical protein